MSQWFIGHRQQFIFGHLRVYGQINRGDLMERFDISSAQASHDLSRFGREYPDILTYDGKAKTYVVNMDALPPGQPADLLLVSGFEAGDV